MTWLAYSQTRPGTLMLGVLTVTDGDVYTVECTRCRKTGTDRGVIGLGFSLFVKAHQEYDLLGNWVAGERLCRECRTACGCLSCLAVNR